MHRDANATIPTWLIVVTVASLLAIVCVIYIIRNIGFV